MPGLRAPADAHGRRRRRQDAARGGAAAAPSPTSRTACRGSSWRRSPSGRGRPALAQALGVRALPGLSELDAVAGYLYARRALLVLDNCEHVVGGGGPRRRGAAARVPVADDPRDQPRPLGMRGETRWAVPPLSLPAGEGRRTADSEPRGCSSTARAGSIARWPLSDADAAGDRGDLPAARRDAARARARRGARVGAGADRHRARARATRWGCCRRARGRRARHQTLQASLDWSYGLLPADANGCCARSGCSPTARHSNSPARCAQARAAPGRSWPRWRRSPSTRSCASTARRERALPPAGDRAPVRARAARGRRRDRGDARSPSRRVPRARRARGPGCADAAPARGVRGARRRGGEPRRGARPSARGRPRRRRCGVPRAQFWCRARAASTGRRRFERALARDDPPSALRARALAAWAWIIGSGGDFARANELAADAAARAEASGDEGAIAAALLVLANHRFFTDPLAARRAAAALPRARGGRRRVPPRALGGAAARRRLVPAGRGGVPARASTSCARGSSGSATARRWRGSGSSRARCATRSASTRTPRSCSRAPSRWRPRSARPTADRAARDVPRADRRGGRPRRARAATSARDPRADAAARRQLRPARGSSCWWPRPRPPATASRPPAPASRTSSRSRPGAPRTRWRGRTRSSPRCCGCSAATTRRPRTARARSIARSGSEPLARGEGAAHARPARRRRGGRADAERLQHEALGTIARARLRARAAGRAGGAGGDGGAARAPHRSRPHARRRGARSPRARVRRLAGPARRAGRLTARVGDALGAAAFERALAEGGALEPRRGGRLGAPRPRRAQAPRHGWESLTPTELEVVRQAAAGLTNPQIAERLFVARATVKTHLSHIYAKLGVRNRSQLAAHAAGRLPPEE